MKLLSEYLNSNYIYTPYIHEIGVVLKDVKKTLILSYLINLLRGYNDTIEVNTKYGKEYHFYRNQTTIAKQLGFDIKTFQQHIKKLMADGYITCFGGRANNGKGYNTTYFLLNMEAIQLITSEGRKKLGGNNGGQKNPTKKQNQVLHTNPSSFKKSTSTHNDIIAALHTINELQAKYNDGKMDEMTLTLLFCFILGFVLLRYFCTCSISMLQNFCPLSGSPLK